MECLYNEDVREIQDKINYIIEQVQILTARPATDASLGVVGFCCVCWKQESLIGVIGNESDWC